MSGLEEILKEKEKCQEKENNEKIDGYNSSKGMNNEDYFKTFYPNLWKEQQLRKKEEQSSKKKVTD